MNRDEIWAHIHRERSKTADLLETLTPEEWEHPSLCAGWTVRDVAAHIIASPQAGWRETAAGLVRAHGSFNRAIHDDAKRRSARPTEEIVADFRRYDGSRRHPPGTSILDPLADVLVHTQDIAIPLGREVPMPPDAARAAAERIWRVPFPHHARRRLAGCFLVASDIDWVAGHGALVEGTMGQLLLLLTGRTVVLRDLAGDGVTRLSPV